MGRGSRSIGERLSRPPEGAKPARRGLHLLPTLRLQTRHPRPWRFYVARSRDLPGTHCQPRRCRTARTVEGHQRRPPCAVGVPLAFSSAAIEARLMPAARSDRICRTSSGGSARGRPRVAGFGRLRAARRRSRSSRSSSSTGISFVPQGSSTSSRNGSSRVERRAADPERLRRLSAGVGEALDPARLADNWPRLGRSPEWGRGMALQLPLPALTAARHPYSVQK